MNNPQRLSSVCPTFNKPFSVLKISARGGTIHCPLCGEWHRATTGANPVVPGKDLLAGLIARSKENRIKALLEKLQKASVQQRVAQLVDLIRRAKTPDDEKFIRELVRKGRFENELKQIEAGRL